jgi:hypothetical protein
VPTDVAIDPLGSRVAVVYDKSKKVDLYQISIAGEEEKVVNMSFERSVEWPSQPLSITFQGKDTLIGVLRDPEYCISYHVNGSGHERTTKVLDTLRQVARAKKFIMPETILEKDAFGNIKLQKLDETRGPSGADAPWNRVERIDIHKKRNRRAKKRRHDR